MIMINGKEIVSKQQAIELIYDKTIYERSTIDRYIDNGKISVQFSNHNRRVLITKESIDKYLTEYSNKVAKSFKDAGVLI